MKNIENRSASPLPDEHLSNERSTPAHGVGEWAKHTVNWQVGCGNRCRYCFSSCNSIRFKRTTPTSWGQPVINQKAVAKNYRKLTGRIMVPTSFDIVPGNLLESLVVLSKLLRAGNELLIVSKPNLACIQAICADLRDHKEQILFRFTIGSADDKILKYWEPGAPSFKERLASLKWAFEAGFSTSVSCEPMLDKRVDEVVRATKPYVTDAIWLGRVNRLRQTLAINCPGDAEAMRQADQLLAEQTDDYLRELYRRYKADPKIKYKDSIKEAAGLERPTEAGLDV